jgi:hypothetical protein
MRGWERTVATGVSVAGLGALEIRRGLRGQAPPAAAWVAATSGLPCHVMLPGPHRRPCPTPQLPTPPYPPRPCSWSAAAVRSALLTSALNVTNRGNPLDGTPFHYGAGLLNPKGALDPGLVYDAGDADAQRYLCSMVLNNEAFDPAKTKPPAAPPYCASACADAAKCAYPQALRDYNQASFSLPGFKLRGAARKQSARRAVSFVGTGGATFTAQLTLPAGYKGAVAADGVQQKGAALGGSQLSFSAPGEAKAFTLSVTATRRAPKGWSFGSLTWVDANGRWVVRSTIALQRA